MKRGAVALSCGILLLGAAGPSLAQAPADAPAANRLRQPDAALKDLTAKISPAVVPTPRFADWSAGAGSSSSLST